MKKNQNVGKVLAGYSDPDFPMATSTVEMLVTQLPVSERVVIAVLKSELFRNVSGFTSTNTKLNIAPDVLDSAFVSLLIYTPDIIEAQQQQTNSALSQYTYRFRCVLQQANEQVGTQLTVATCCEWGALLKSSYQLRNHLHVGRASAEKLFILEAAITQSLVPVNSLRDSTTQLQACHECLQASQDETTQLLHSTSEAIASVVVAIAVDAPSIVPVVTSFAGVFYNWHTTWLWKMAADKKEQNAWPKMRPCIKIMKILYQARLAVLNDPLKRDVALYKEWEQQIWVVSNQLAQVANDRLHGVDGKKTINRASSLRKRWKKTELDFPDHFTVLTCWQHTL